MIRAGLSMGPALIFIRRFVKLRIRSNKITTKIRSKSACASTFTLELCLNPRTLRLFALELCLNPRTIRLFALELC